VTDSPVPGEPLRLLSVSGVQLNLDGVQLRAAGGHAELNLTEFRLFRELMENAGIALTRERLTSAVWGDSPPRDKKILETYIARARRRLRQVGADHALIRTVRGTGFVFDATDAVNHVAAEAIRRRDRV
jgi:DNA-binding response OmpR family regulator